MTYDAPFAGLKVVDLSQGIAGPYSAMLLAQYGADVVKVEPPEGDWARGLGKRYGDMTAFAIAANLGKRSIVLDLKSDEDRRVLRRLVSTADVFLESFRPGVAARGVQVLPRPPLRLRAQPDLRTQVADVLGAGIHARIRLRAHRVANLEQVGRARQRDVQHATAEARRNLDLQARIRKPQTRRIGISRQRGQACRQQQEERSQGKRHGGRSRVAHIVWVALSALSVP